MSNKTNKLNNAVLDLNLFDDFISLYNIILHDRTKQLLTSIAESLQNNNYHNIPQKPISILIIGTEGKRTIASAMANSLDYIYKERLTNTIESAIHLKNFLNPNLKETVSVFVGIENTNKFILNDVYSILRKQEFEIRNPFNSDVETIIINGLLIFTCNSKVAVNKVLLNEFDYVVEIIKYTNQQIRKIIMQRLGFCGVGFSDDALNLLCNSCSNVRDAIRILKYAFCFMRADCRFDLNKDDITKAVGVLK